MKACTILSAAALVAISGLAHGQIAPLADLTDGEKFEGQLPDNSINDESDTWHWFTFSANAGDAINIEVDRTVDNLDPVSGAWLGDATGSAFGNFPDILDDGIGFPQVGSGDDDDPPATGNGPWGDPNYDFVAPETATYSVAVASFVSDPPPWTYSITVSGSTVPAPASLALLGLGGALAIRRRR